MPEEKSECQRAGPASRLQYSLCCSLEGGGRVGKASRPQGQLNRDKGGCADFRQCPHLFSLQ